MKISQIKEERLMNMTPEEKWEFVCGGIEDKGESADIALLLGSRPAFAKPRAYAAARLYLEGRVKYIVPSGGVEWDVDGERMTEADYMKRILISEGVPEEAIIMENEATTTKENMIYGTLQINRATRFAMKNIMIVTSLIHMKRSLMLAKVFLPTMVNISYCPSEPDVPYEKCMLDTSWLDRAIRNMKKLVDEGFVEDYEVELD